MPGPTELIREILLALRRWRTRRLLSVTAALTLALGIGATTAVFSVVDAVFLRPLPYPHADRLVTIWGTYPEWRSNETLAPGWDRIATSWPEYVDLRANAKTVEDIAIDRGDQAILTEGASEQLLGSSVSANFFRLLGASPIVGKVFDQREDDQGSQVVVLASDLWRRRFGADPSIVGKTIRLDNRPFVVVGVLEAEFRYGDAAQYWIPAKAEPDRLDRGDHGFRATARMRPGVNITDVQREVEPILRAGDPPSRKGAAVGRPFDRDAVRAIPILLLLSGSAAILLLIACANVAGLLLGEAVWRQREMAVRAALGASRSRLLRQLFVESATLALIGTLSGIGLAFVLTPALVAGAPPQVPHLDAVAVNARVLAFACITMVGTALLFGCGPAVVLARRSETRHLYDNGRTSARSRHGQSMLVVGEVAITMIVLFAAGLLVTTLSRLARVNPGFASDRLLTMRVVPAPWRFANADRRRAFDQAVLERLSELPGIRSAAWIGPLAFSGQSAGNVIEIPGVVTRPGELKPEAQTRTITPGYFATMGIPLLQGRAFADTDGAAAPRVAIVSSLFERRFSPGSSAIGLRFRWQGEWWTVVGVVSDIKHQGLEAAEQRTFYVPVAQKPGRANQLVIRTATTADSLAAVAAAAIRSVDEDTLIQKVESMDGLIAETLADDRYRAVLVAIFAIFATLLAAVGLYGTISRSVSDRRREIGVRLALGARSGDVLRLVFGESGRMVFGGVALGLLATLAGGRALRSMLFAVSWFDPGTLVSVVILILVVALVSTLGPARRAARLDPMAVLRE